MKQQQTCWITLRSKWAEYSEALTVGPLPDWLNDLETVITASVIHSLCDLVLISLMRIQTNQSFSWWSQRSGQPPTPGSEISDLIYWIITSVICVALFLSLVVHPTLVLDLGQLLLCWIWLLFVYMCVFYTWTNDVENQVGRAHVRALQDVFVP